MGMYDDIVITCWWCHQKTYSQTKLSERQCMAELRVGDCFNIEDEELANTILELKNNCHLCNHNNAIVIVNGQIKDVIDGNKATLREGSWGAVEQLHQTE